MEAPVEIDQDADAKRMHPFGVAVLVFLVLAALGGGATGTWELVVASVVAAAALFVLMPGLRAPKVVTRVMVRCAACRHLNEEHAAYCSGCGKPT